MKLNKSILLKSFIVSILYVGFGTFSVFGLYPDSPVYWELSYLGLLITIPVSVAGAGIAYMESESYGLILLVQTIVFFLFWLIVYRIWMKNTPKKSIGNR